MVHHIVLFQFHPEVPEAEIAACVAMLRALPAQIAAIRGYEVAYNRKGRGERYHVSIVGSYDDLAALDAYEVHPAHAAFSRRVLPLCSDIIVFDSEAH